MGSTAGRRWLRAGAVSLTAGAMLAAGSGIASADRGDDAGPSEGTSRASSARAGNANATASRAADARTPASPRKSGAVRPAAAAKSAAAANDSAPAPIESQPTVNSAPANSAPVSRVTRTAGPAAAGGPSQTLRTPTASVTAKATGAGPFLGLFGNGTAENPDAGLLFGNGFSYDAGSCPSGTVCNGGKAGLLFGDGGNGWNGGSGGNGGFFGVHLALAPTLFFEIPVGFYGKPGDGGNAAADCTGAACTGGKGGNAISYAGAGGMGGDGANGGNGGVGGNGGWLLGSGGRGGDGFDGGYGGKGGRAGLLTPWAVGQTGLPPAPEANATAKATSGGPFLGLFGNGTPEHPDAGLLIGNGYSWAPFGECPSDQVCDGGDAGWLFGDGGAGANGGKGGDAGLFGTHIADIPLGLFVAIPLGFYAKAGDGGSASYTCVTDGITCNGGDGGNANPFALVGWAGYGGDGNAAGGGVGGKAGRPGAWGYPAEDGGTFSWPE